MGKFVFGEILKDKVTGFIGVVMARTDYATGCIQYGLSSRALNKDGGLPDWIWIDQIRLESTGDKVEIEKDDSGPAPAAPQIN